MTERRFADPFETHLADRVRAYSDPAAARRIDALEVSRAAMSTSPVGVFSDRRLGVTWRGLRIERIGWAAALVAVLLIAVIAITVQRRQAETVGGPIPELVRHSWERPLPVAPGPDVYGSGFLSLATGQLEYGREPGSAASRSAIAASGFDLLLVTATVDTVGCAIGDIGSYRWSVDGQGTVLTLTTDGADACGAREQALAGPWVRSDLPPPANPEATLTPGTHLTSSFDPFGDPTRSGQLSYTVPGGWKVKGDEQATLGLHRFGDGAQNQPSTDVFVELLAQPRMAAEFPDGSPCGPLSDASGVGSGVDDIVAAITARPGVVSTAPTSVTIDGYQGTILDLHASASWTGACVDGGRRVVVIPILKPSGLDAGPWVGIGPDAPVRLILLKLTDERTMAIAIFTVGPSQASPFDQQIAPVMPVIESFVFHP